MSCRRVLLSLSPLLFVVANACSCDEPATPPPVGCDVTSANDDCDGDGRTNSEETGGYQIVIDLSGFGIDAIDLLTARQVTSDPLLADTDDDGLEDNDEFLG